MIETPHLTHTSEVLTAVIHVTVSMEQIREVMGPAITEVREVVAAQGIEVTGAWFTHHLHAPTEEFDLEIGVPVATLVAPAGRVIRSTLPAKRVARTEYTGPYEGLRDGWGEFIAWIEAQGHPLADELWEIYTTGPESEKDPEKFRTELVRPIYEPTHARL